MIKRYDCETRYYLPDETDGYGFMDESPRGEYVKHADHAAIAAYRDAEIERLTAENTEIRDACEKACQSLILVMNDRDDLRAKLEAAERDAEKWRESMDVSRFEKAPCYKCGYNGFGYYQPDVHQCAKLYHAEARKAARGGERG